MSKPLVPEMTAAQMRAYVTYTFPSLRQNGREATVTLLENHSVIASSGTTGLRTWEASLQLTEHLTSDGIESIQAKNVLELGAGTGLVSIVCSKYLGAKYVLSTDGNQDVVEALEDNAFLNGFDTSNTLACRQLRWGRPVDEGEDGLQQHFDTVLGADIVRICPRISCEKADRST